MMLAELSRELEDARRGSPAHATVLATHLRFSRNFREPFVHQRSRSDRLDLRARVFERLGECQALAGATYFELERLAPHELILLRELMGMDAMPWADPDGRGVVFSRDPRLAVLVGEEDHLRIFCLREGQQINGGYACADCLDADLEERFDLAFSEEFGYLCARPWRTGTGMKASASLHLPALAASGEMPRIRRALAALAMSISESGREGSGELAGWVEVANLRCLGEADTVYLEQLAALVSKLDHFERRARERWLSEARSLLEDRIWSAYGQLRHGRLMPEDRARELLGTLRLGALAGIIQDVSFQEISEIWMSVRDGRLQVGGALGDLERQERRAGILRDWLAAPKA